MTPKIADKMTYFPAILAVLTLLLALTNSNPAPDAVSEVCSGGGAFYADASDCNAYIQCANGKGKLQHCPSGLHWNAKANLCDWPEDSGCIEVLSDVVEEEENGDVENEGADTEVEEEGGGNVENEGADAEKEQEEEGGDVENEGADTEVEGEGGDVENEGADAEKEQEKEGGDVENEGANAEEEEGDNDSGDTSDSSGDDSTRENLLKEATRAVRNKGNYVVSILNL